MSYTWSPYPFLRITVAFILGILAYKFLPIKFTLDTLTLSFGVLFLIFLLLKGVSKKHTLFSGNIGLIIIGLTGCLNAFLYDQTNEKDHFLHFKGKAQAVIGKINSALIEKDKYFIYEVELDKILTNDSMVQQNGIVRLYIKRMPSDTAFLTYGDRIYVKGSPFRLPPPDNPNEFNYMEYMAGQNIYFQHFSNQEDIKLIDHKPVNSFMAWAITWRGHFSKKIDSYIQSKDEAAIAKALILGVKDGLDNKIKKSYASAGAMHVLAVSGLHAGIIHLILQFLFKPFIKRKPWKYILPVVSILCLWLFAMITGLSPSIMRATTMFSIIILGEHYFQRPNVFNSLSLSAFILLLYNPNFVFSVGFQLSYIAVAGIVYLYPIIYNVIDTRHWLFDKIWSISSVSIAAQIATFPLTLYYFHQFPVYFLLSNLVVIPAAFLIMSMGIVLLLSNIFFISDLTGFILELLIKQLNRFVFYIQKMDMSLIEWIYLNEIQLFLIYAIIILILMLINYRKGIFVKLTFACIVVISISGLSKFYNQWNKNQLIFYNVKGQSLIEKTSGLSTSLYSVNQPKNIKLIKHQVDPYRLASSLVPVTQKDILNLKEINKIGGLKAMTWKGKKILFVTERLKDIKVNQLIECDQLVVSNNSIQSIEEVSTFANFQELIIDSSNDFSKIRNLIDQIKKLRLKYHSVAKGGALILKH